MNEIYTGIKELIPEVCPDATRDGGRYRCDSGCIQLSRKEKYICPCFDRSAMNPDAIIKQKIEDVKRWNNCRQRIPKKTNWSLKGIKYFRIYDTKLLIERFDPSEEGGVKKEILKLFKNGDKIEFNEDYGIGKILDNKDGTYTVEKWIYQCKSNPVLNGSLNDVFAFLYSFWR